MSFLTLYTDEHSWLASEKRVFSAQEMSQLHSTIEQLQHVNTLAEAQQQRLDEAVAQAHKQGYLEGHEQAVADAQRDSLKSIEAMQSDYTKRLALEQKSIVSVALDVVRKVAGKVAPEDWLLAEATQAAAELSEPTETIKLHVATTHVDAVRERLRDARAQNSFAADYGNVVPANFAEVVADETLDGSACVLSTPFGTIDVDLETQLTEIDQLLTSQVSSDA